VGIRKRPRRRTDNGRPDEVPADSPKSASLSDLGRKAADAFRRELPQLLEDYYGQWVLYHGGTRIAVRNSPFELDEESARRSYREEDCLKECVMPEPDPVDPGMFLGK